jgi:hypothetical protein
MSSSSANRRDKGAAPARRGPMFDVQHDHVPPPNLRTRPDPFDDPPEALPRVARHRLPLNRTSADHDDRQPAHDFAAAPRSSLAADMVQLRDASEHFTRRVYEPPPPSGGIPIALPSGRVGLAALLIVCAALVWWLYAAPERTTISSFRGPFNGNSSEISAVAARPAPNVPANESAVVGDPSIAPDVIDAVLAKYGSPAQGTGKIWYELGKRYGIDPAFALAFFIHESSAGTNPAWAGLKPGGGSTHNVGNIICAGYPTCFGRFRDYGSWDEGIEDWYKLISTEYVDGRGAATLEQIIPIYAPSSDNNNVPNYIQSVIALVSDWRQGVVR